MAATFVLTRFTAPLRGGLSSETVSWSSAFRRPTRWPEGALSRRLNAELQPTVLYGFLPPSSNGPDLI